MSLHEKVIEVTAAFTWIALDECKVLRGEDHGPQDAEDLARALHRSLVDTRAIGATRSDLDLEDERAIVAHDIRADHRALGALTHQGCIGSHPVAAQGGQIGDCLDEVGLALAIGPYKGVDPWLKAHLEMRVIAHVGKGDVPHPHGGIGGRAHFSRRGAPA